MAAMLATGTFTAEDANLYVLIDFYKCYRAVVRAKTTAFQLNEIQVDSAKKRKLLSQARQFMDLAYEYALCFTRPTLWIIRGLPASGKSTLAAALSNALDIALFSSDVVRKELFGLKSNEPKVVSYKTDIYSKEATALTYGQLLLKAQEEIKQGRSVILDATFSKQHQRIEAARLAEDTDANLRFIECCASRKTLLKRLSDRETGVSVSDARADHFEQIKDDYEPLNKRTEALPLCVNTDQPLSKALQYILSRAHL